MALEARCTCRYNRKLPEAGAGIIVMPGIPEADRLGGDMALAEALVDNGVVIAQTGTTS